MKILQISRRHFILGGIFAILVIAAITMLGGCFSREESAPVPITAATDAERAAFLREYGWEINENALETLDLVLPLSLEEAWADYVSMQNDQQLPFAHFGGQAVRRYTYSLTNYPDTPQGAQVNLYQCGQEIIGADIIVLGENGRQCGLLNKK